MQRVDAQPLERRQTQEAAVRLAGDNPRLDLVIVIAREHLKLDVRIELTEALEDQRQPLSRDAGKGRNLDKARFHPLEVGRRLHKAVVLSTQTLDLRQEHAAVRRKRHAAAATAEQAHAQLILERLHCVAHARLREAHALRRLREAPALHRPEKNLILRQAHTNAPSSPYYTYNFS